MAKPASEVKPEDYAANAAKLLYNTVAAIVKHELNLALNGAPVKSTASAPTTAPLPEVKVEAPKAEPPKLVEPEVTLEQAVEARDKFMDAAEKAGASIESIKTFVKKTLTDAGAVRTADADAKQRAEVVKGLNAELSGGFKSLTFPPKLAGDDL